MKSIIWGVCILSLLLPTCNIKKEKSVETNNEIKKTPFSSPQDSSITVAQMQKWLSCNRRLDSLSYLYLDSFSTKNAESRLLYQQNFIKSQDTICVQQGLSGGYEEYIWVLKNSGNRKNRPVLDSLNLETF